MSAHGYPEDWENDSSYIECANCGERFFYELTHCPNCGRSVYEPEYDEEDDEIWGVDPERDSLEEWFQKLAPAAAIFMGLVVSFLSGGALFVGLRFLLGSDAQSLPGRALMLAGVPAGAAIGGLTAAAIEGERPRAMGWWVGALSIISATVFAAVDRDIFAGSLMAYDVIPLWGITVLSGAAGGEYLRRRRRSEVVNALFGIGDPIDLPDEAGLYEALYVRTGHDAERVERLIEHERQYMPNASRRTLLESALNRWERDNR